MEQVVLLVNKNEREQGLDLSHYKELNFDQYHISDALTSKAILDATEIKVEANSSLLLHFKKSEKERGHISSIY